MKAFAKLCFLHEFKVDFHRGDRRAQIVADSREQLALALKRSFDLIGHGVEGVGRVPNVIGSNFRNAWGRAAARGDRCRIR